MHHCSLRSPILTKEAATFDTGSIEKGAPIEFQILAVSEKWGFSDLLGFKKLGNFEKATLVVLGLGRI